MFPIASASFKCIASTPFSASSLQPSHSQRLLSTRHSPPVERRRQHIAVVNGASDVNNVTDGGTSDSHRSFIERDANKSARVLQNQKPLRFGFIGCGAMAEAMARGFLDSKVVQSESIACYGGKNQTSNGRASLFKEELGIENIVSNASAVLDESDIIFLCVKPNKMLSILDEIKPRVKPWHVFVSVAAGIKTSDIEKHLNIGTNAKSSERGRQADGSNGNLKSRGLFNLGGRKKDSDSTSMKSYDYDDGDDDDDDDDEYQSDKIIAAAQLEGEEVFYEEDAGFNESNDNNNKSDKKDNANNDLLPTPSVVRVMPNTPCFVREGAIACCGGKTASLATVKMISSLFSNLGLSVIVEESQMHAVVGVSGSGPAYVFAFIEALADGAVLNGLPRSVAMKLACQTVIGAGKLCLETQVHPGELKDRVCSPGGTTISAMRQLEKNRFRSAVIEAVTASAEKSKQMKKN
jgi:pyrroline-5-carboxylate reductase